MDFRELKYITAVADCGSVTEAAKLLYVSQPSLSSLISKVENELGVQLFNRKSYPLTLTYAGEKYVDTARKILRLNDTMRREMVDIGLGVKGKISFGIPTERAGYMLPRVIPQYKRMFPGVEVKIYEAMSDELYDSLQRDKINFYIVPKSRKMLPQGVAAELIYRESLYLVAGPGVVGETELKDPQTRLIAPAVLRENPFIPLKRGHAIRKKVDSIFKYYKITPNITMEVSSCISAVQLAAAGLGITIVPRRALEALGGIDRFHWYRYSETPDMWDVNVVYKEGAYLDRTERSFIDLLKTTFTDG